MGLRNRIRRLNTGPYAGKPPYGASPDPLDMLTGTTPPAPDPGTVRPRSGPPIGASGRANFYGLPQPDETNSQLIGPEGLRNFDLMYRTDADIRRLVLMCWSPIAAATWGLEPYGGDDAEDSDTEIAETIWWALTRHMSPTFTEHLNELGPSLLRFGFTPFEQIWEPVTYKGKTLMMPRKLAYRLPRSIWRWWQDDYGELTHIAQILPNKPDVVIPINDIVYYRLAPEGDNWAGTSLLRHAYKSWVMKDRLERIDAIGQERKAVGVPIVYMPENADDQTRDDIETVLASLHTNEVGYLMMPGPHAQDVKDSSGVQGYRVEVITFDSSSGSSIQDSLKYHRDGIASAFLGDFMQLGHHAVGARATAQVQQDPFETAIEALVAQIVPPLDRLVARIVELNWPDAEGPPKFRVSLHDSASLSELSGYVQQLVASGAMQVDPELEDYLRERADLPPANPDVREQRQQIQQAQQQAQIASAQAQASDPMGIAAAQAQGQTPPAKSGAPSLGNQSKSQPAKGGGKPANPKTPASAGARNLDTGAEPTVKWWENLLSQDKLREALDGARNHIDTAIRPLALTVAAKQAHQAANGANLSDEPPVELVDAFTHHLQDLYQLGLGTVQSELDRQRRVFKLDDPGPGDIADVIAGTRWARTRDRGEHAARTLLRRVNERLRQRQIAQRTGGPTLQILAEREAVGALHQAALDYASSSIADGRADAALADSAVVGGIVTAVLDERSCDPCIAQDTGQVLPTDQAIQMAPNPNCDGGDRCRCQVVFVLADDPAAATIAFGG